MYKLIHTVAQLTSVCIDSCLYSSYSFHGVGQAGKEAGVPGFTGFSEEYWMAQC